MRFTSTEQLRDMARKSGSKVFTSEQTVVITYEGFLDIKTLAFYEICLSSTEMRYACMCTCVHVCIHVCMAMTYEGFLDIKALVFYEICLSSTEMRYACSVCKQLPSQYT